jgi:hypothetical protein
VLTDRATFDYLQSTGAIHALQVVTRDNDASARGTNTLLVNSFHAYAINARKFAGQPNVQINSAAATAFLDWVTSPEGQARVGAYLGTTGDAPFLPDASPAITAKALPRRSAAGKPLVVRGSVANVVPGTPPLAGVTVTLSALRTSIAALNPFARPVAVATMNTTADGSYVFRIRPTANARYTVSTPQISQIENAALKPVFGDLLSPGEQALSGVGAGRRRPATRWLLRWPSTTSGG